MHLLGMTTITEDRRMNHRENGTNLMPDRGVAFGTFNLMVGHMGSMHEEGMIFNRWWKKF